MEPSLTRCSKVFRSSRAKWYRMLQPQGKCANVCAFTHPKFFPMTASISPLRLENGRPPDCQSRVHWPRCSRFLAAHTSLANWIVLPAPLDHSPFIFSIQSETSAKQAGLSVATFCDALRLDL